MEHVTFIFNGIINGRPSWAGAYGSSELTILWNGTYWVMYGWPYDGEPRNYTDTLDPTTGWELYNNTTLTATFNVVLGACPIPTPSPTVTPSKTPTPSVTPGISRTPTPTPTPSQTCSAPILNSVTLNAAARSISSYTFGLFFTPTSTCGDMIYEYSCDGTNWTSCGYSTCGAGFGCVSPVEVSIDSINICTVCSGNWYFRIKQCCGNLQSNYSNVITFVPVSLTPTRTPSVTRTPTRTPSLTPTKTITPSVTATPSITITPSPSVTPGLCRYVTSLESKTERGGFVKVGYTNCNKELQVFNVYLPTGSNIVDISTLNICMLVGTSLTVSSIYVISLQPIFGAYCS